MKVIRVAAFVSLILALPITTSARAEYQVINDSEFASTILGEVVSLQVALPASYEVSTRGFPVLYLLDGNFFMHQAVSAVDFLSVPRYMDAVIPSYIVVGITTKDRNHDFTPTLDEEYDGLPFPTSGGGEAFQQFLVNELIPSIDSTYRTTQPKILAGWSLGGLFATWTYLTHPESFDRYLAISPSLWWDEETVCDQARTVAKNQGLSPRRLTLTLGGLERAPMDEAVEGSFLPVMKSNSVDESFEFIEIAGEGHNTSPPVALHKGLVSLHRMTMIPDRIATGDLDVLAQHLIDLAANRSLYTNDATEAGQFLIKQTVQQGTYEIGMQIAQILADRISASPRSMVAVGEMAFRLNRYEDSLAAFRTAIAREETLAEPNPEELQYFREYLEWIQARVE